MPEVIRAHPDTTFQFIGADPPRDVLRPNVECTGFVDDISSYLRRATFVIAPMLFGHGMSTKIVTALAFGKTVLASPQAIGAIATKYDRLHVAALDEFATTMIDLLSRRTPHDAQDFEDLCTDYGWPRLCHTLYERIEQCCGPRSVP